MNNIYVQKIREAHQPNPLLQETSHLLNSVQRRAFELFQNRGYVPGHDFEDWFQAENEILQVPRMDLTDNEGELQIQLTVPGFEPKDVHVAALPDSLIVEAESTHQHRAIKGNMRVCEIGERKLFRQIPLPEPVDVDKVSATLDKGLLEIKATKAEQHKQKKTAA